MWRVLIVTLVGALLIGCGGQKATAPRPTQEQQATPIDQGAQARAMQVQAERQERQQRREMANQEARQRAEQARQNAYQQQQQQSAQNSNDRWDRRGAPQIPTNPPMTAIANAIAGPVMNSLVNPASAQWGQPNIQLVSNNQGVQVYSVSGYVDCTNRMGGTVRAQYSGTVSAQYYANGDGSGNWNYSVGNISVVE